LPKIEVNKIQPSIFPGITWFIISTILLILPGSAFPKENWLDKIWFDKWVHIGLFGIMVFLFGWGLLQSKKDRQQLKRNFLSIALVCLTYGIIMEFIQDNFIPNRSFDYGDIIADFVGCLAGWRLINKVAWSYIKNKPL